MADARRLLANARRVLRRAEAKAAALTADGGRDRDRVGVRAGRARAVNDLAELPEGTGKVAARTRQRLAGIILHCTTAMPGRWPRAASAS